jgi:hypothetical protein
MKDNTTKADKKAVILLSGGLDRERDDEKLFT